MTARITFAPNGDILVDALHVGYIERIAGRWWWVVLFEENIPTKHNTQAEAETAARAALTHAMNTAPDGRKETT